MAPEFSITELERLRLEREIEETIRRNKSTYAEREEEYLADQAQALPAIVKSKDPRGSKAGIKRGKYKRTAKSNTKLKSSGYYGKKL